METTKQYIQPEWSKQLCALMKKNLINTIDVMEYADIIGGKKMPHLKDRTLAHVERLYLDRIGN